MKIFHNAQFISCEDSNRFFRVLIEEDGKILFCGDEIPEKYSSGQKVNLNEKCVIPAFGDTHIHFSSFCFVHSGLDCRNVENFEELGIFIKEYIENNPKEKVVLGFGCSAHTVNEKRLPEQSDLDKITSHPLMIVKYDGHAAVANTALLSKLPSVVLKDKGFNKKTGWLYGSAFYKGVNSVTEKVSLPVLFKNMISGSDFLARKGIGLVHASEGVGFPLDMDVFLTAVASLGLPQKFRIFFQTMNCKKVHRYKMPRIGGCFETALDGCFGSEDAALREPYSNNQENRGELVYSQSKVNEFVKTANRAGLQVALHAIGDAAIEQALTAYEEALSDFPRDDHRHIIIHSDLMDSEMIERAANIGVCIALQTPFLDWREEPIEYLEHILGKRINTLIPLKSMLDAGLVLASGSDAPCTIPDPIYGIHAACNHPNPAESISVLDALKMHTNWCAKLSFDENERGTLTEGKNADFVVLDQNPLNTPIDEIKNININDLYLEGRKYTGQDRNTVKLIGKALKRGAAGIFKKKG
ncbi:MAG: amidohydrolase [Desulfobacterales bacterium]|nr:amidohydrolase [Desulfobacterales bacterium]